MNNIHADFAIHGPPASFTTTTPFFDAAFIHRPKITGAFSPDIAVSSFKFADVKPAFKTPCTNGTPVKECLKEKFPFLHLSQREGLYKDIIEGLPAKRHEQRQRQKATKHDL